MCLWCIKAYIVPISLHVYVAFVNGGYMRMVPTIPLVATSVHLHAYMPMLPKSLCCRCDYGGYMCLHDYGAYMPMVPKCQW